MAGRGEVAIPLCPIVCHCLAYLPKLAGPGVPDVPLLLPSVGLDGQLPGPRGREDARVAVAAARLLPIDVLALRGPRCRGIRALKREPRAAERPARPVLHDVEQSTRITLLVPVAIDAVPHVVPVHDPLRWGALRPPHEIDREQALVARDADAEGRREVTALDLAIIGIGIGAVAVVQDVAIVSRFRAAPGRL